MNDYTAALAGLRLAVDKPGRVYLRHPGTGDPLIDKSGNRAFVDMMSRDSMEWQERDRDLAERRARNAADGIKTTVQEGIAEQIETLSLMARDWHLVDFTGAKVDLPFSVAAARYVFNDRGFVWLREQASQGAVDRSLFMPVRSAA